MKKILMMFALIMGAVAAYAQQGSGDSPAWSGNHV